MRKFLVNILIFIVFGYFIGEFSIRVLKLGINIPEMYQDTNGLIKNLPNQTGYYLNGNTWSVNKFGEFGYEPKSLDSLITVIGDSFIENIMNPNECHQAYLLSMRTNSYNFYPSARSGANLIEFMEMTKSLTHLNPVKQILYVHDSDFSNSIREIKHENNTFQWSIRSNNISYPQFSENKIKKVLYNFQFMYYIYRNYIISNENSSKIKIDDNKLNIDYNKIQKLLDFINKTYITDNIIIVFSPNSDKGLIEMVMKNNFQTIVLKTDDIKTWEFLNDSHWTCFGHEEVAKQVSHDLNLKLTESNYKNTPY